MALGLLLPLHSKPVGAYAAVNADSRVNAAARVAVLSIKLTNNAGWRSDDAHLAILGRSVPMSPVNGDVSLVAELPLVGRLTAVHFKHAGWRSKLGYHRIDVFSDIFSPSLAATSSRDAAQPASAKAKSAKPSLCTSHPREAAIATCTLSVSHK